MLEEVNRKCILDIFGKKIFNVVFNLTRHDTLETMYWVSSNRLEKRFY